MKYFQYVLGVFVGLILIGYILNSNKKYGMLLERLEKADEMGFPSAKSATGKTVTIALPEQISFAGEPVPLDIPDVRERLDREIHINAYWHNNSIFIMKRANRWLPSIEAILKKNGIPDDFKYLAVIESGLENVVSHKKAVGFWQILKPTAEEFGLEVTREVDERYNPLKATEAACKYLKRSYRKFGNWTLVAASFNRGMRGVEQNMKQQKMDSYYDLLLNDETSRYVFRILACKDLLEHPKKYNFDIKPEHLYEAPQLKAVTITESIDDLAVFAKEQGYNYKILKKHNPWLRRQTLSVKRGKAYTLLFPV